jgi:hypothetical protein
MVGASSERCREHASAARHKKTDLLSEVGMGMEGQQRADIGWAAESTLLVQTESAATQ